MKWSELKQAIERQTKGEDLEIESIRMDAESGKPFIFISKEGTIIVR